MDGESESAKQRLDKINKALEEYEHSIGIPVLAPHNEAERYLNMSHKEMNHLSDIDCGEAATVLAQYSFHIQRAANKELGIANWADDMAKKAIASELQQYRGASFEERRMQALKENEYANKLDQIRIWARARYDKIAFLSNRIEFIARTFMDLQQTKRRQRGT